VTRVFEDKLAVRERTPVLVGIISPSGAGKTYSALRLATGIQRVVGGDIGMADTEARRGLHYADDFKFRHLDFKAPFAPADYLEAIEHLVYKRGVKTVIVDSTSHEHEGTGGVLEMHEAELNRIAGNDWGKRERSKMLAWAKPKAERRKLINAILQMEANFIFCFRAKEKIKPVTGGQPIDLGFQAISGDDWIYEMQLKCVLMPGSDGVPTWQSDKAGEALTMKLPKQFRPLFPTRKEQLTEEIGQKLAEWAAGNTGQSAEAAALIARYRACADLKAFDVLEAERKELWPTLSGVDKASLKQLAGDTGARIAVAATSPIEDMVAEYSKCTTRERHAELEQQRAAIWKGLDETSRERLTEASNTAPIGLPEAQS